MYISNEARIIRESSHGYDLIPIQDEMLSHREVELVGEVDAASVNALVRQLRYLQRQDPEGQITLFINSPGGSVDRHGALRRDAGGKLPHPDRLRGAGGFHGGSALRIREQAGYAAPQPHHDP